MKAMTIYLFDTGDQIRCITFSSGMCRDMGWDWGCSIGEIDGYSEASEAVRNHILGCIASIDWRNKIERLPTTPEYHVPDKFRDFEA